MVNQWLPSMGTTSSLPAWAKPEASSRHTHRGKEAGKPAGAMREAQSEAIQLLRPSALLIELVGKEEVQNLVRWTRVFVCLQVKIKSKANDLLKRLRINQLYWLPHPFVICEIKKDKKNVLCFRKIISSIAVRVLKES